MDFKIRPWTFDDLDSLVLNANNDHIAKNLTDGFPHPYTKENGTSFITMAIQQEPPGLFAIDI